MKHTEIKELLPLYIDGGLEKDEMEFIEAHLVSCPECRDLLRNYEENYGLLTSAEDIEVSADFLTLVMKRIEVEKQTLKPVISHRGWFEKLIDLFKVKMQIPVGAIGVALMAVLIVVFAVPLANLGINQKPLEEKMDLAGRQNEILYKGKALQAPAPSPIMSAPQAETRQFSVADRAKSEALKPDQTTIERKIIKTANLRLEVKDLKSADNRLLDIVKNYDGFIANSSSWVNDNRHFSNYQLRIPADQFYQALAKIEEIGENKFRSLGGQDITDEYIDISSRLKNLKLQEERYREILGKAGKVEDILRVERELERVRSEIESLQGRINYYDNQVSLSTIDVELGEPQPIGSSNWGIMKAVREAINAMIGTLYQMIIRLGQFLPYVVLFLIIYGIYRVVKRSKK